MLCVMAAALAIGQTPKAGAPVYPLPAEASKVFVAIDRREAELRSEFAQLENNRTVLLIGANVPEDSRSCMVAADGIVTCAKPKPSPSPSPQK